MQYSEGVQNEGACLDERPQGKHSARLWLPPAATRQAAAGKVGRQSRWPKFLIFLSFISPPRGELAPPGGGVAAPKILPRDFWQKENGGGKLPPLPAQQNTTQHTHLIILRVARRCGASFNSFVQEAQHPRSSLPHPCISTFPGLALPNALERELLHNTLLL